MPSLPAKKSEIPPSEEWISVKNPKLGEPDVFPRVPREAYEAEYKALGWEEIPGTSSSSPNAVEIPAEPESARKTTTNTVGA